MSQQNVASLSTGDLRREALHLATQANGHHSETIARAESYVQFLIGYKNTGIDIKSMSSDELFEAFKVAGKQYAAIGAELQLRADQENAKAK